MGPDNGRSTPAAHRPPSPIKFIRPPLSVMRQIMRDHPVDSPDIALDMYCHKNVLLREFFWLRLWMLTRLMRRHSKRRHLCLDFGGGSGVFLPTLSSGFETARLIDRSAIEAEELKRELQLDNVIITTADITEAQFDAKFDAIVAADVLEHFIDLEAPLARLREWLRPDGVLYTSLPTENYAYRFLRVVFRKSKPLDHYRSAREVEDSLRSAGFRKVGGLYHPLLLPVLPLFRVSAWSMS